MARIRIGVQEADRNRFDVFLPELGEDLGQSSQIQRLAFFAIEVDPSRYFLAQVARNEPRRLDPFEVEEIGAIGTRDFEYIPKARRRNQTGANAAPLCERIDNDRRAV